MYFIQEESSTISRNTARYSQLNNELNEFLKENPKKIKAIVNKIKSENTINLVNVKYDLVDLPIILDQKMVSAFNSFIKTLPKIIEKAIKIFFGSDLNEFSTYLNEPPSTYKLLMNLKESYSGLVARYDLVCCSGELKLLELNAGTNLGGWELDWLHSIPLQVTDKLLPNKVVHRKVTGELLNFLAKSIADLSKKNKSGNIFFKTSKISPEVTAKLSHVLQLSYESSEFYQNGKIILSSDVMHIEFGEEEQVTFLGEEINAFINLDESVSTNLSNDLTSSTNQGQIIYPESPVNLLYGNKVLMALVHEKKVKDNLSIEERCWIEKHVPWTVRCNQESVYWENINYNLADLLKNQKDRFVLKKSNSFGGKDVVIGKFTEPEDWETFIYQGIHSTSWIVQEYCPSDVVCASDLNLQPYSYDTILGIFGFGDNYSGILIRGLPKISNKDGVINCSKGALGIIGLEEIKVQNEGNSLNTDNIIKSTNQNDASGLFPFPVEVLKNNKKYSNSFEDLIRFLESDKNVKNYQLNLEDENIDEFMKDYEFPVSPWPFIISKDLVREFDDFITPLVDLCYLSIKLFFEDDKEKFSTYFNEPALVYGLLKDYKIDSRDLLIRHDIVFSDNKFKLLEINVGSTVGGWQHDWISTLCERSLKLSEKTAAWNLTYRNIIEQTFTSICNSINRTKPFAAGNILLFSYDDGKSNIKSFRQSYTNLYNKVSPFKNGTLFFFNDFNEIEFSIDGSVTFRGETMDAVLLTVPENIPIPKSVNLKLVSCYLSGKVILPDNPLHSILGNNLLLALLHETTLHEKISSSAKKYINKYIPWTVLANKRDVIWKGEHFKLRLLLIERKNEFVIKKARSLQGRGVHIGRYMSTTDWEECINKVLDSAEWLVQEYCEPDNVLASSNNSRIGIYKPVFGVFDLNNTYSGSFVRATEVGQGNGVINSANGALEFTVFEECNKNKLKIVIS